MRIKWGIHNIYFYLVCFVTLIMIIFGITQLFRAGIELLVPVPGMSPRNAYPIRSPYPMEPGQQWQNSQLPASIIESELQQQEEFNQSRQQAYNVHNAIQQLFRGLSFFLVAFPVYLYHWRKIPLLEKE
ncbi:MAG: hypothetical protein KGZ79_00745 [Dethiobacter sp.]|jgi:hypothetical protein|nr:hypothetical protein [Dethiobacter sp.]